MTESRRWTEHAIEPDALTREEVERVATWLESKPILWRIAGYLRAVRAGGWNDGWNAAYSCRYCGLLGWTIERYGRVTHKHGCHYRTEAYCQAHVDCEANVAVARAHTPAPEEA